MRVDETAQVSGIHATSTSGYCGSERRCGTCRQTYGRLPCAFVEPRKRGSLFGCEPCAVYFVDLLRLRGAPAKYLSPPPSPPPVVLCILRLLSRLRTLNQVLRAITRKFGFEEDPQHGVDLAEIVRDRIPPQVCVCVLRLVRRYAFAPLSQGCVSEICDCCGLCSELCRSAYCHVGVELRLNENKNRRLNENRNKSTQRRILLSSPLCSAPGVAIALARCKVRLG